MAHDCAFCGNTCRCGGDIDDVYLPNPYCKGCGCETDEGDEDMVDFDCDCDGCNRIEDIPPIEPMPAPFELSEAEVAYAMMINPALFGITEPIEKDNYHCVNCGNLQEHEAECEHCGGHYLESIAL